MKVEGEDIYLASWRRGTYKEFQSVFFFFFYWKGGAKIVWGNPEISMKRARDASSELCGFPSVKCALCSHLKECVNAKKHV